MASSGSGVSAMLPEYLLGASEGPQPLSRLLCNYYSTASESRILSNVRVCELCGESLETEYSSVLILSRDSLMTAECCRC